MSLPRSCLLLAPALAFVTLAAHFLRAGALPAMLLCLALAGLPLLRRAWVPGAVQAALALAAAQWLWTALLLVQQRLALGQPWGRLGLILGTVAVLTGGAALVFRHPAVRARYAR